MTIESGAELGPGESSKGNTSEDSGKNFAADSWGISGTDSRGSSGGAKGVKLQEQKIHKGELRSEEAVKLGSVGQECRNVV